MDVTCVLTIVRLLANLVLHTELTDDVLLLDDGRPMGLGVFVMTPWFGS